MTSPTIQPTSIVPPSQPQPQPQVTPIKSANFDLLSDIDFSGATIPPVSTPPLQPQLAPTKPIIEPLAPSPALPVDLSPLKISAPPQQAMQTHERKPSCDNLSICSDLSSSIDPNYDWESASVKNDDGAGNVTETPLKDPFEDPKVIKWFHKEVERLEKFIETAMVKTLNGTTPLDGKWKELQDLLVNFHSFFELIFFLIFHFFPSKVKDESKRLVNVAKLFPEKNRSIDSLPYDHARVSLGTSTDDYINAGFVKVNF